jgi:WD40 repeat protein
MIPVRTASGPFTYSPDGKALYGQCTPYPAEANKPLAIALCKIDLKTGNTTPVAGTQHAFGSDTYSRHRVFDRLFGLTFPGPELRTIRLQQPDMRPWTHLSICPGGERAVGTHNGRVELIDTMHGTTKPLDGEFFIAAWSPDGKLLAALENGEKGRTVLMDATTLLRRRTLGPSDLDWSPDSRYLLGLKSCDSDYATLEIIDVETGARMAVESSKCQINQVTAGWVSTKLAER